MKSSGNTNLFYLPQYFRKVEKESKAEEKRRRKRQFNSIEPTILWMTPEPLTKSINTRKWDVSLFSMRYALGQGQLFYGRHPTFDPFLEMFDCKTPCPSGE